MDLNKPAPIVDYEPAHRVARKVCDPPPKLTKGNWIVFAMMFLLPIAAIVYVIMTDDLADYRFVVPLAGGYFVQRLDQGAGSNPQDEKQLGPYQLFLLSAGEVLDWEPEGNAGWGLLKPSTSFVPNVEQIALLPGQPVIIGKLQTGYFVLNVKFNDLQVLNSAADFDSTIKGLGASSVRLNDPAVMAKSLPRTTIRPWAYQQMNGLLWLSDVAWSSIIQDMGGMIALTAGLAIPRLYRWKTKWMRRLFVFLFAAGLGTVVNAIANGWMFGGGPDAFVGEMTLPIGYWIAALLGGGIPLWVCGMLNSDFCRAIARLKKESEGRNRPSHEV